MTRTRRVLLVAVVAIVILVVALGGRYVWAVAASAAREPVELAAWSATFGDPDALIAQHLHTENNVTARRLAALATPLGVEFDEQTSHTDTPNLLGEYLSQQTMVRRNGDLAAPPAEVQTYLDAHRSDVAMIVDLLTSGETPVWRCDITMLVPACGGALAGRALNNALLADALMEASRGRTADADRALRAAWQVSRSMRDAPQLIGELVAEATTMADDDAIRRTAVDAGTWRSRLSDYDYPAGIKRALEMEVVQHTRVSDRGSFSRRAFLGDYLGELRGVLSRDVSLVEEPAAAPEARRYQEVVGRGTIAAFLRGVTPGMTVAVISAPAFAHARQTALRIALDIEMTEYVLDARQARARMGHWPVSMPDGPSAVVPGERWVYSVAQNGDIKITFSRTLPEPGRALAFEASR